MLSVSVYFYDKKWSIVLTALVKVYMLSVYGGHTATGLAACIVDNERLEVILHDTTDICNIYMGLNNNIFAKFSVFYGLNLLVSNP